MLSVIQELREKYTSYRACNNRLIPEAKLFLYVLSYGVVFYIGTRYSC